MSDVTTLTPANRDDSITIAAAPAGVAPCTVNQRLYLAIEVEPTGDSTPADWETYTENAEAARSLCERCPRFEACLTDAVTGKPIRGFVAGTSLTERKRLRARLGMPDVVPEQGLPVVVDRQDVAAAIAADPTATVKAIAARTNTSERTVKRTRAAMRAGLPQPTPKVNPAKVAPRKMPVTEQVVAIYQAQQRVS